MIMSAWLDFGTEYIKFLDQDRAKIWNFSTCIYRVLAFYTNMRDSRGLLLIFLQILPKRAPKIGILTKTVAFYLIFFMCWICCLVSSYIWDDILFKLHLKFLIWCYSSYWKININLSNLHSFMKNTFSDLSKSQIFYCVPLIAFFPQIYCNIAIFQ